MNNEIIRIINSILLNGLERFGKYYASYRGFVYDREDPLNCNRLQLIIPSIAGNEPYRYWALPIGNYSGKGYGSQVLPQKKELVWVEFEMGNPKRPLWKHGHFGKDEKPNNLKDYNNYWFKTPEGNLVEFDDTNKLIKITSAKGKVIEISDKINIGGDIDSKEPALLGNKTYELLNSILEGLENATTNTLIGPQPLVNKAQFTLLKTEKLPHIKSENVNLIP